MIEASQAAAQQAKENMKNVYAKATKIFLDVNLKAPDIIVPVDSQSDQALILDLGVLALSNIFLTLEAKNEKGFSAVIDELKINLSQFQLSRVRFNDGNEKVHEMVLIEPINIDLVVRRNLSSAWFTSVPDIYVTGKIKTIKVLHDRSRAVFFVMFRVVGPAESRRLQDDDEHSEREFGRGASGEGGG